MTDVVALPIGIDFIGHRVLQSQALDIVDIYARSSLTATPTDLELTVRAFQKLGYIGGREDGIVTLKDNPVRREILVLDGQTRQVVKRIYSLPSGHYLADDLDPNGEYLILARPTREEGIDGMVPPAWDYVKPAVDLSISEQYQLWQTWQSE